MVPNPRDLQQFLKNPFRDAAIHFGAHLQCQGLLSGDGTIEQQQLLDHFTNHYQPKFHSCLSLHGLLATLRNYKVILKNRTNTQVRVAKHPRPENVKVPESVTRTRIYVDQPKVLRDKFVPTEVFSKGNCVLCKVSVPNEESKAKHVDSDLHKFRLMYHEKRSSFSSAVDNASISIVGKENSEVLLRVGEYSFLTVQVSLSEPYVKAEIFKILELPEVDAAPTKFLNGEPIKMNVTAMFDESGAYLLPMVAKVQPNNICLLLDLTFRVESELIDQLAPVSPYKRRANVIKEMMGSILPGEELPKADFKLQIKVPLGEHKIPVVYNKLLIHKLEKYEGITPHEEKSLADILELLCGLNTYKEAMKSISDNNAPYIQNLGKDNYSARFALLLDMEELQQQRQVKNYDRSNEKIVQCNTYYTNTNPKFRLQVPDLSEGRPSVTKGHRIHVRLPSKDDVLYEGVIHEVLGHELILGFHNEFSKAYADLKKKGEEPKVDVRFTLHRFPILNMHRALTLFSKHDAHSIVFPEGKGSYQPPSSPVQLKPWQNKDIAFNPEQQRAVTNIANRSSGNAPYLVFGPPGTGKTVTLVESISQVWLATPSNIPKQLVCAPSNAACDNIATRLICTLPKAKIFRLFSLSVEVKKYRQTPGGMNLLKHSNYDVNTKEIWMPTMDEITANEIIVATIVGSGRLVTGGGEGIFQFVYIDECGQASEPEALISIAGLLTTRDCPSVGQLVLAGDPQQLGPVLCSPLAIDFGLGMSLLERLMKHIDLYKKDEDTGYNCNYLTKLVQNYRSHPAILQIPNELFYENELVVKGNPEKINKAVNWKELPNKTFPLIFHGVQGIDERESNSPSYFNRSEIDRVIMYIQKLLTEGLPEYRVSQEDIGIIAPYRKQVKKFKKAFDYLKWSKIRVGSVEEFQGSEKLIIFISTVRSSVSLVEEDYRFKLGFLQNPKRFNVSVTRAQALLVVVGNPNILRHDKQWYQLLKYCRDNNATVGVPVPMEDPPEHPPEHVAG